MVLTDADKAGLLRVFAAWLDDVHDSENATFTVEVGVKLAAPVLSTTERASLERPAS